MNIPTDMRPLGGVKNVLPEDYTRLDFLESDGVATMALPFESKNKCFVCEHTLGMPKATSGVYAYGGTVVSAGYAIRYNAANQALSFTGADTLAGGTVLRGQKYKTQWKVERNEVNNFIFSLSLEGKKLTEIQQNYNQYWQNVYNVFGTTKYNARVGGTTFELTINIEGARVKYIPAIDSNGVPCMYGIETRAPFYNSGAGTFIAGVGTVGQLTALLRKLPATGGELTLSLPAEANTPEVADMLQACYDTKGWTITVHEYRPAAASTYSLRRVREVVWCRKAQTEMGSYVDTTGARYNIEHCVAIYGENGNATATYGYEPFDSVEQAAAEWGFAPIEYSEASI